MHAVMVLCLVGPAVETLKENTKATAAIEGTWVVVATRGLGKTRRDTRGTCIMVFKGGKLTIKESGEEDQDGLYKINASMKPKALDIILGTPPAIDRGIYKIKGDKLVICKSSFRLHPRPTEFNAEESSNYGLLVLKRVTN